MVVILLYLMTLNLLYNKFNVNDQDCLMIKFDNSRQYNVPKMMFSGCVSIVTTCTLIVLLYVSFNIGVL